MKRTQLILAMSLLGLLGGVYHAAAIGTAFTYQGRLADNGSPASGNYDLRFTVWDSAVGGLQVGGAVVVAPVGVSSGLFTVPLDFGGGIFTCPDRWLEIESRLFGGPAYSLIAPRQKLTPAPYAITAGSVCAVAGAVQDVSLSTNVALLGRSPQTFTGANIFDRGSGGPGRLMVTGDTSVDTTEFTGLGFQYYDSSGEGAIMSSYSTGYGFLSFYTKSAPGQPIGQRMIIDKFGNVAVDQGGANDGVLNNGTVAGAGLTFGIGSGEGIASKRTAGGNQFGLDFYTGFARRMSLTTSGNLSFIDPANSILFPATTGANNPMIYMFDSGTGNVNRMVIAHSPSFSNWGLQYEDTPDKFHFLSGGVDVMTVDLGTRRVGIGTASPAFQLELSTDSAGKPNGGSWANSSDARLKKNIRPLTDALDRLVKLRGVSFEWIHPQDHANQAGTQAGFVAQEVERVFPKWVNEVPGAEHDKTLTPNGQVKSLALPFEFDALVVEAFRELRAEKDTKVSVLEKANAEMHKELAVQKELASQLQARLATLEKAVARIADPSSKTFAVNRLPTEEP